MLIRTARTSNNKEQANELLSIAEYLADDFSYHYERQIEGLKDD